MSTEPDAPYGSFPQPGSVAPKLPDPPEVLVPGTSPEPPDDEIRFGWWKNAVLFVLTVVSVYFVAPKETGPAQAWMYVVPLMTILLTHEFGHYVAARLHRVPASLPYFLPLPILNPFGTLGAVILMPKRIRSRAALLDIGAAGPLAGMVVAVPVMLYGLALSRLGPRPMPGSVPADFIYTQEGQSLLYWALKYAVFGPIPANQDVYLHPVAFAAWTGFFVTFLNLLPFGQLDGGHIAYAVFGERQNRIARYMLWVPLGLVAYNFWEFVVPVLRRGMANGFGALGFRDYLPAFGALNWVVLFLMLLLLRKLAGSDHPPVDDRELSTARRLVGIFSLILFVALFMPSPLVSF